MFQIKICGLTSMEDARATVEAGADAVGLNFYPKSARSIPVDVARRIVDILPRQIVKVGLFVNAQVDELIDIVEQVGLDLIQLHGDEPPEYLARLGVRPVLRAFRLTQAGLPPIFSYLDECERLGFPPRMVLMDSYRKGEYGGTGETANWGVAAEYAQMNSRPPLVLAGGLTPENVADAIRAVHPAAVDTASGVEFTPGHKDPSRVEAFVRAAREAMST